jgi:ATP-binding cassette, subfamily G (WHITE), member 2, SNQ2
MATSPNTEVRDDHVSNADEAEYSPIRCDGSHTQEGPRDDNNDLSLMLSRKLTSNSTVDRGEKSEEWAEIERLMSRMFGRERKEQSAEEKSRHTGVVWKNLNVKGAGLGAALQPTVGDIFLGLPRLVKGLLSRGRNGAGRNVPVKTILHDFSVKFLVPLFYALSNF